MWWFRFENVLGLLKIQLQSRHSFNCWEHNLATSNIKYVKWRKEHRRYNDKYKKIKISNDPYCVRKFWLTAKTCLQELTANFEFDLCYRNGSPVKAHTLMGNKVVKRKLLNFIYFSIVWWWLWVFGFYTSLNSETKFEM